MPGHGATQIVEASHIRHIVEPHNDSARELLLKWPFLTIEVSWDWSKCLDADSEVGWPLAKVTESLARGVRGCGTLIGRNKSNNYSITRGVPKLEVRSKE